MVSPAAVQRRMTGQQDSRSTPGMLSRGSNVYNGGSPNAQSGGGPQFGRPPSSPPAPPGLGGGMPPGMGGPMPPNAMGGGPPVENPMAPIVQNMQQLENPLQPSPGGETANPIIEALKQGGPPGMGGVGGNPSNVSPEIMAAIVRKLGAGGGMG